MPQGPLFRALLLVALVCLATALRGQTTLTSGASTDRSAVGTAVGAVPNLTRGPYLQMGTPTSVRVRWRTDSSSDSRVRYGLAPGSLTFSATDLAVTTEHEVALTGLQPGTRYYYAIGTSAQTIAGDDESHFFVTAPPVGSRARSRIWVLGDSGSANANAVAVANAYRDFAGSTHTNLWLMLGDNAYVNGTDAEYQVAVFDMYPWMLRTSVLWSTIGNHDTAGASIAGSHLPYFQIFSLPTAGEAGGAPSGTEKYYSFDYGNVHFICLDSMTSDRSVNGPMLTWLRADLESTTQPWVIAFWHHPPYSKGSHDSDFEVPLVEMRQNALPILESHGVDLVLAGHSHSYERSYLIDSHYGASTAFISSMKKDGGSGRPEGSGAYRKRTAVGGAHEGAVYAVAGSSATTTGGALNHPAMFVSLNELGSLVLDVEGGRLDAKFLRENGTIADSFTIIKGAPDAPANLTARVASPTQIDLTWRDRATNEESFRIDRCIGTAETCDAPDAVYVEIAEVAANVTSYANAELTAGTRYSYRVRAVNVEGSSHPSNTAAAIAAPPPETPANLTATVISSTRIDLVWTDSSADEESFRIDRCSGTAETCDAPDAVYVEIDQLAANGTSYTNAGLTAATRYSYRVRAVSAAGSSPSSNTATAITYPAAPAPPAAIDARATSANAVTVTWSASTGATAYVVERRSAASAFATIGTVTSTSFVDTTVAAATSYLYRVQATNSGGTLLPSIADVATTVVFTDDALAAGTAVRAVHLSEVRTAVNALRTLAGVAPATFSGAAASGMPIAVTHVVELRSALDEALAALALPTGGYSDTLAAGVPIRAVHMQELREGVR